MIHSYTFTRISCATAKIYWEYSSFKWHLRWRKKCVEYQQYTNNGFDFASLLKSQMQHSVAFGVYLKQQQKVWLTASLHFKRFALFYEKKGVFVWRSMKMLSTINSTRMVPTNKNNVPLHTWKLESYKIAVNRGSYLLMTISHRFFSHISRLKWVMLKCDSVFVFLFIGLGLSSEHIFGG